MFLVSNLQHVGWQHGNVSRCGHSLPHTLSLSYFFLAEISPRSLAIHPSCFVLWKYCFISFLFCLFLKIVTKYTQNLPHEPFKKRGPGLELRLWNEEF